MTFALTFLRDPEELRELATDPATAYVGDLLLILMRQQIILSAGRTRILDTLVPLFYMAAEGLRLVESLSDDVETALEIPEGSLKLTFHRRGDSVAVREFIYSTEGAGSYSQLLEVWRDFSEDARQYMLLAFPGLAQHSEVGGWFRTSDWNPDWN